MSGGVVSSSAPIRRHQSATRDPDRPDRAAALHGLSGAGMGHNPNRRRSFTGVRGRRSSQRRGSETAAAAGILPRPDFQGCLVFGVPTNSSFKGGYSEAASGHSVLETISSDGWQAGNLGENRRPSCSVSPMGGRKSSFSEQGGSFTRSRHASFSEKGRQSSRSSFSEQPGGVRARRYSGSSTADQMREAALMATLADAGVDSSMVVEAALSGGAADMSKEMNAESTAPPEPALVWTLLEDRCRFAWKDRAAFIFAARMCARMVYLRCLAKRVLSRYAIVHVEQQLRKALN